MSTQKIIFFIFNLENLVQALGNSLKPGASVRTALSFFFEELCRKVEWVCLIWGVQSRKTADRPKSSQLILLLMSKLRRLAHPPNQDVFLFRNIRHVCMKTEMRLHIFFGPIVSGVHWSWERLSELGKNRAGATSWLITYLGRCFFWAGWSIVGMSTHRMHLLFYALQIRMPLE